MGLCSKPKAPAAPDPVKTAQAQADADIKVAEKSTALNRYNETNPYGSQRWTVGDDGKYTLNTNLNPVAQNNFNVSQANTATRLANDGAIARGTTGLISNATDTLNRAIDPAPVGADAQKYYDQTQNALYDPSANVAQAYGTAAQNQQIAQNTAAKFADTASKDFNYDSLGPRPEANEATRQSVADSLYEQSASRLDPRFEQRENDIESALAAKGITVGSEAYDREKGNLMRDRNDAYTSAQNTSNSQSIDAMQKLFGMELANRQQGVGEANTIRALPGQEAALAGQLSSQATQDANQSLNTDVVRESAVPGIAQSMFNLDRSATEAGRADRMAAINEVNAVRGGNPNTPANPGQFGQGFGGAAQIANTPFADSVYNSYQGDLNNFNAKTGSYNNTVSGIAGLGSSAATLGALMG